MLNTGTQRHHQRGGRHAGGEERGDAGDRQQRHQHRRPRIKADDGGTVELVNDTITGGTIALNGATAATTLQIEGTVTLSAGTTTTLSDYAGNAIVSTHDEVAGAATLINYGNISGAGTIGDTTGDGINLTLDNFGDIAAAATLYQRADAQHRHATPSPTRRAARWRRRAGRRWRSTATSPTPAPRIKADDGGTVELVNDTITGGTIALNGATAATTLQIEGTVTLSAGTTMTLTDYANNAIVSTHDEVAGAAKLINHGTISGAGTIGDGTGGINLTLDNFGDIAAAATLYQRADAQHRHATPSPTSRAPRWRRRAGRRWRSTATSPTPAPPIKADDGGTLELVSDTITGGTIELNGATTATTLQIEGTVTLSAGTTRR